MDTTRDDGSTLDLDGLRSKLAVASPGPWSVTRESYFEDDEADVNYLDPHPFGGGIRPIRTDGSYADDSGHMSLADAEFIAAAHNEMGALLEALIAERDRADRAEARLAQILEYADSTYTASTVARRIVQMGKATA